MEDPLHQNRNQNWPTPYNKLTFFISKTFTMFWMLYSFFWVIPRCLNFKCRRFRTLCLFHLHRQVGACRMTHLPAYEDGTGCSETSAFKIQKPGNNPKESIQALISCNIHQCSKWPNPWITGLWPTLTWHICSSWDVLHQPGCNQEPLLWLQTSVEHIHELQISGRECVICFLQPLSPTDPTKNKNKTF